MDDRETGFIGENADAGFLRLILFLSFRFFGPFRETGKAFLNSINYENRCNKN